MEASASESRRPSIGEHSMESITPQAQFREPSLKGLKGKKAMKRKVEDEAGSSETSETRQPLHPELQKEALRIAKERSVIVSDEEMGRKKLLEVFRLLKDRDRDVAEQMSPLPAVNMLEYPGYYHPWTTPLMAAQSADGKPLPEEDYVTHTYIQRRMAESSECGPGAKEVPLVAKFPNYSAWSPCPRNEVTEAERVFQGIPALEGLDPKFIREYTKEFTMENVEKRRIKNLLLSDKHIAMLVTQVRNCAAAINDSVATAPEDGEVPEKVFEAISEAFGGTESHAGIMHRYYRAIGEPKQAYLPNLTLLAGKPPTVARFLDSCSRLVCNRCFRYDCLEHPFMTERAPQVFPMTPPLPAEKPCGPLCHLKSKMVLEGPANFKPFTQAEQVILKSFLTEEAESDEQTYCDMAVYSGRPCHETYKVIHELLQIPEDVDFYEEVKGSSRGRTGRGPRRNNRRYLHAPAGKKMRQDLKNAGQVKQYQYVPCSHGRGAHCGDADAEICNCVDRNTYCERFCGCGPKCPNRFGGCNCTGDCRTKRCPCFVARRECDPEVCRCQARNAREKCCKNTQILFNCKKKVKCGPSEIHGWGAFIMEDTEEGDFICEYTGEVITQEEAERRGKLYDRVKVSYLFDLNLEYVVDAARKGNKIRYANHSSKNPNCVPEIYRVQGDNRIGIFAKRPLKAGEELFFDYSYTAEALKFVQIEASKKGKINNSLDPRVASMEQNVDSRNRRATAKARSRNSTLKSDRQNITFEEVESLIHGVSATLAFDNEEDEAENEKELAVITKDFDLVEAAILKGYSNGVPIEDEEGPATSKAKSQTKQWMKEAYAESFPKFRDACPDAFELSPLWERLREIALVAEVDAETLGAVAVPALIVDLVASPADAAIHNGQVSATASAGRQKNSTRTSSRHNGHH